MEFEQILTLIDHISGSELTSFQYETETMKLSIKCGKPQTITVPAVEIPGLSGAPGMETAAGSGACQAAGTPGAEAAPGNLIKSPLVGTFYAAPAEDAEPYVKVGDSVKKGQVLAIVEAMKLMNEIESDFDGEIAEIYVKNQDAVEYGQPLFRII